MKISLVLCKLYLAIAYEFMELLEAAHSLGIWVHMLLLSYCHGQWNQCTVSGDQRAKLMKVLCVNVTIFINSTRREEAKEIEMRL